MKFLQSIFKPALASIAVLTYSALPFNSASALQNSSQNSTQTTSKTSAASINFEINRSHALNNLLTQKLPQINIDSISTEQIKQVAKTQNATLIQYSFLPNESELAIWVIKPTGDITMRRVDLKAWQQKSNTSLTELIKKTRSQISGRTEYNKEIKVVPHKDNNDKKSLTKLHQVLIQPIADLLPNNSSARVIFIPQNQLFLVPFAALQDNSGKYLIEKHTISTAPSIQTLDLLQQRKTARNKGKFVPTNMKDDELLIVGNPTAPKVSLTKGDSCKPPSLPGAEREAKDIAERFKTQALTGDAATETAIVDKMPQARIIHLAAMTYSEDCKTNNSPGVVALASSNQDDGWLRTSEINNLNLKADLVVLSGCETALGRITGDGVIGLSRSFIAAGADSVIGSLWLVPDESTATLMTEFHKSLSNNTNKAGALRQAMLETMKKYPNPRDWAGFRLVGLL